MIAVEFAKWGQSVEALRLASLQAKHARTRERFQALYLIASGQFNAASWAKHAGRRDETVLGWLHAYNKTGPDALVYCRTGGRAPLFAPAQADQLANVVRDTTPAQHGLPGRLWTLKKLKAWAIRTLAVDACRGVIRRVLEAAKFTWKKVKKLLGKANPAKRADHVARLQQLFEAVRRQEITLLYIDESHFHRDLDLGYGWGPRGERLWRVSDCPGLSQRINWYGAYDFTHGECHLWHDGRCNGEKTAAYLEQVARWRKGKPRIVLIWDGAPWHRAKLVQAKAAELGIEVIALPGYSPDLNPIERLWDWLRDDVTRGHCHASLPELQSACESALARINSDPLAVVTRLWPKFDLDPEFEKKLSLSI